MGKVYTRVEAVRKSIYLHLMVYKYCINAIRPGTEPFTKKPKHEKTCTTSDADYSRFRF